MPKILTMARGVTLVELVLTVSILAILASAILPLAQMSARRTRELELRRNLRIIRTAIDDFNKRYEKSLAENKLPNVTNKSGYPATLQELVDGYDFGEVTPPKRKFLRRIPVDPFNPPQGKDEPSWGLRSYSDKPDSTSWGGEDVYDVYSLSEGTAIDGSRYKDW